MAKRKTTSQPELEERKKYNYPLELVASVALALLNRGPEPDEELTPADWMHSWDRAVMDAIAFLGTCERGIRDEIRNPPLSEKEHERRRKLNELEDLPAVVPFKKAILRITSKRSEAEALPIYKEFLADCPGGDHPRGDWGMLIKIREDGSRVRPDAVLSSAEVLALIDEQRKSGLNREVVVQAWERFQDWSRVIKEARPKRSSKASRGQNQT